MALGAGITRASLGLQTLSDDLLSRVGRRHDVATGRRALRCPAVIQYCKEGEKVRAPTSEPGGLKVTFFPFVGKEGR